MKKEGSAQQQIEQVLNETGALKEGHFVGTGGSHMDRYVNKDALFKNPYNASYIGDLIAMATRGHGCDVVVVPAIGAIPLGGWVAYHLTTLTGAASRSGVTSVYAHQAQEEILVSDKGSLWCDLVWAGTQNKHMHLAMGERVVILRNHFKIRSGFAADVAGKKVLVVEDSVIEGGSARKTVEAVRAAGGEVDMVFAVVNGGTATASDLSVSEFQYLARVERKIYSEDECRAHGLCHADIPINTDVGHGAAFLARQVPVPRGQHDCGC